MWKGKNAYFGMMVMVAALWGTAYPTVRFLVTDGVNAELVICMRVYGAFLFAVVMMLCSRQRPNFPAWRQNIVPYALMGMIGSAGFLILMTLGLRFTEAGKASFLAGSNPIIIVILAAVFLGEPLNGRRLVGVMVAVLGVGLTVVGGDVVAGQPPVFRPADLILLGAAFCWAVYSVLTRVYGRRLPYASGLVLMFLFSSLAVTPLFIQVAPAISELTGRQVFWLLYCGFAPGGVGYVLWNKGVNVLGASVCGIINSFVPVFATIFSVLTLGETMVWLQVVGGALVLLGVTGGLSHVSLPVNTETGHSLDDDAAAVTFDPISAAYRRPEQVTHEG